MSRGERTKEERFLIKLFEAATRKGSYDTPIDRDTIGLAANLHTRQTQAICNQLLKTNFIKKGELDQIYLTPNGLRLVESLISNS
jgi:predicted transcriptional regulator